MLADADPTIKAELYASLGVRLTYDPDDRLVEPVEARCHGVRKIVSEGGLEPPRPCGHQPLKLARLPIPPLRRGGSRYRMGDSTEPF